MGIGYTKLNMGMTALLLVEKGYTGAQFMQQLGDIVVWITSIAGAMMVLYAVYIAFLFATASDANKRKAARERLIKTVASALIIIALASVLAVIKVTFNTEEGNFTGPSAGGAGSDYNYNATPTMKLSWLPNDDPMAGFEAPLMGTLELNSKYFTDDNGKEIDPEGDQIEFQDCHVVKPQEFWNDNKNKETLDNSAIGQAVFRITIPNVNSAGGQAIPCIKGSNDNYTIRVTVKFVFKDDRKKISTSTIDAVVDSSDCYGITLKY